jgi:hypothetical protein
MKIIGNITLCARADLAAEVGQGLKAEVCPPVQPAVWIISSI